MTIEIFLLVWNILLIGNILLMGNILLIGNTLLIRYILLLSSINFGTEISKRLLLRGPDGHWGSRQYTIRLFNFVVTFFQNMSWIEKILLINQMQPVWLFISSCKGFEPAHKTLKDCKTAQWFILDNPAWLRYESNWDLGRSRSLMLSVMRSVMQLHMGFIVTSFMWYVMGQVIQSIEGLKTQSSFHIRAA